MKIDWTFAGCDQTDEMEFERHWEQVQIELEGKLAELPNPASHLRMAVEKDDASPRWTLHAALHLPAVTMVADGEAYSIREALDKLLASLAARISQHEDVPATATQRQEGLEKMALLLDDWKAAGRSEAFLSFLLPVAVSLTPYIERELQLREMEGAFSTAVLASTDVIDEVLVNAWEKCAGRDSKVAIDLWLMKLADEAMDRLGHELAEGSLDDDEPISDEARANDRDDWDEWIEHAAYRETQAISELLPGQRRIETWDELDWETKQGRLAELLNGLKREERQAVVFNIVYGYSPAQIADFQDRDAAAVEEDVAQGINQVRRNFHQHEEDDWEESFTRQQLRMARKRGS